MLKKQGFFPLFVVLTLLLLLLSLFANVRFLLSGRASGRTTTFSSENSYLAISPLEARANAKERIRLTIFVINDLGVGVPGKEIVLSKSPTLLSEQVQKLTDSYGRAVFDLFTGLSGEYFIEATIDNVKVGSGVKVRFN